MTDPIRIPLSSHQVARLAAIQGEIDALVQRKNEAVTMAIAGAADPVALAQGGWSFALHADAIVCTPPASHPPLALEA